MAHRSGRHFLQIPGPTNVPDRVLRAIDRAVIDHRGPEFSAMAKEVLRDVREVFNTTGHVVIFPSSGTGAWEAAIVNTLSPGDGVLMFETGHFSTLWADMARRFGLEVEFVPGDWRHGADPAEVERRLRADAGRKIRAVMVVHNETATGVASRVPEIRAAMDAAGHDAMLMLDTISSLGSAEVRHDDWRVDVTVAGSQKGLMLPPGLGFNAISARALAEAEKPGRLPRSYWDWRDMIANNAGGVFPYTPATNMLFGLREALAMIREEGLDNIYARHLRHAEATRAAVRAWGLEVLALDEREHSPSLTAVLVPPGHDADALRAEILDRYDLALGTGLAKVKGKVFRIGHLGYFNDLMLMGTLAGIEMGLHAAGVPHARGGVAAAMDVLAGRGPETSATAASAALRVAA